MIGFLAYMMIAGVLTCVILAGLIAVTKNDVFVWPLAAAVLITLSSVAAFMVVGS